MYSSFGHEVYAGARLVDVQFEGDCKSLIDALQGKSKRSFHFQTIINNFWSLSSNFSSCAVLFCCRDCNGVAHYLAKWATSSCCDKVWVFDVLPWLGDALCSNLLINES